MTVSSIDADAFCTFERDRHDVLALSYHDFFAPLTALAPLPLLEAVHVGVHTRLLDIATGSGGVDLAPTMVALVSTLHPHLTFTVTDAGDSRRGMTLRGSEGSRGMGAGKLHVWDCTGGVG